MQTESVSSSCAVPAARELTMQPMSLRAQIKDLNSGTFGFVQLAKEKATGEIIAIKFIERGEKVRASLTP